MRCCYGDCDWNSSSVHGSEVIHSDYCYPGVDLCRSRPEHSVQVQCSAVRGSLTILDLRVNRQVRDHTNSPDTEANTHSFESNNKKVLDPIRSLPPTTLTIMHPTTTVPTTEPNRFHSQFVLPPPPPPPRNQTRSPPPPPPPPPSLMYSQNAACHDSPDQHSQ